ncbi:MAG: hypothetical protein ACREUC_15495 [Steroidobacteraceae bacterium]
MSAPERLTTSAPGRFDSNPVLRGLDPEAFRLHVEFMHSHGSPRGQLTTLFSAGTLGTVDRPGRDGAHRK